MFERALKGLASMGLKPSERLSNGHVLFNAFLYLLNVVASVMYVILEANTFWKYTSSIFNTLAIVVASLLFLLTILESKQIFEFGEHFKKIVEDRE